MEDRGYETPCWIWNGTLNNGYGRLSIAYRQPCQYAHRFSYELHRGPIPDGLQIDHLCRVPRCVNPDHLEVVTNAENTARGLFRWASAEWQRSKTHCPQGHPYNEVNTYYRRGDRMNRQCKACMAEASRRWNERNRTCRFCKGHNSLVEHRAGWAHEECLSDYVRDYEEE